MTKTNKIVYYILLVIVSALFLFSAYGKLSADPMQVKGFIDAHLPLWFMYFIGAAEAAGAIGLWIPKLRGWANCGLQIIMIGAVVVTAIFNPILMALVPAVVFAILWYLKKLNKKDGMAPSAPTAAPVA